MPGSPPTNTAYMSHHYYIHIYLCMYNVYFIPTQPLTSTYTNKPNLDFRLSNQRKWLMLKKFLGKILESVNQFLGCRGPPSLPKTGSLSVPVFNQTLHVLEIWLHFPPRVFGPREYGLVLYRSIYGWQQQRLDRPVSTRHRQLVSGELGGLRILRSIPTVNCILYIVYCAYIA